LLDKFPIVGNRYPICYLAAYGKTFSSVVLEDENETWENFVNRLNSLNFGWNTDELYVSEKINLSGYEKKCYSRGFLDPIKPGLDKPGQIIARLDKNYWNVENIQYVDAHCPRPYTKHRESIDSLRSFII